MPWVGWSKNYFLKKYCAGNLKMKFEVCKQLKIMCLSWKIICPVQVKTLLIDIKKYFLKAALGFTLCYPLVQLQDLNEKTSDTLVTYLNLDQSFLFFSLTQDLLSLWQAFCGT